MTASAETEILSDQAARDRIRDATDRTLFVDAGAGSGKTKALVDRVRTLVLRDGVPIEQIAAVTFTEKAAAELTDRLRARFEEAAHDPTTTIRIGSGPRRRWTSSTSPPSAPCTRSPNAFSRCTRSRPGSRRTCRSSTRSAPPWPARSAGRSSSGGCWTTTASATSWCRRWRWASR